jgi:hypothetical protein
MSQEKRRSERRRAYAKVFVEGRNLPGYLRDVSRQGCQLALLENPDIELGHDLTFTVLPLEEARLPSFSLTLRIAWIRPDPLYRFVGGPIVGSPAAKEQQKNLRRLYAYYAGQGPG